VIWFTLREHRAQLVAMSITAAFLAIGLAVMGTYAAAQRAALGVDTCVPLPNTNANCVDLTVEWQRRIGLAPYLIWALLLAPALAASYIGGPLFGATFERGTHRLAWTQSITRRRWVVTKLTLAGASTLVAAAALIIVMIWWRGPFVRLQGRMDNGAFDFQGTVILGYGVFALGLALAVGAVWRRAVPAVMVAFVGYFGARLFVDGWLRQRLIAPRSLTFTADRADPPALLHAWVISEGPSDALGRSGPIPFGACIRAGKTVANAKQCLALRGGHVHAVFEPASRFWPLQGIETAMFGGLGLALILLAGWWTLHRE